MQRPQKRVLSSNFTILGVISILILISTIVLKSLTPSIYPTYYVYLFTAFLALFMITRVDFEILEIFSPHLYFISILLLIAPLFIGQVTRGAIRWIPIGPITIQPSEVIRPFLLLFFSKYLIEGKLDTAHLIKVALIVLIPFTLILIQPSFGVSFLTLAGFMGVLFASRINKRSIFLTFSILLLMGPFFWLILQPYQKERVMSFLDPTSDPYGTGYNSIQSMIAVGSGRLFGRGLGEGVQTQLRFLPEKHTDFIFAAISEEMGLMGSMVVLLMLLALFWYLIQIIENSVNPVARAYVSGVFLVLLVETLVHIGMNMGLLPITGVPLPFVSAGGSALLGTTIAIAIALNAKKRT